MRLHRFFTDADISGKAVFLSEKNIVHQIIHVLRLAKDDEIVLCKDGSDAHIRITALSKNEVEGEIISIGKNTAEPQRRVALYCSILKKENFEMVVQKTIESGVSEIVPLKTKRTVKTGISEERLGKIAREAAEQCGRARIPVIHESIDFSEAIQICSMSFPRKRESSILYFKKNLDPRSSASWRTEDDRENFATFSILFDASGQDVKDFFQNINKKEGGQMNIFVGPEGGWDEEELRMARERGYTILSLGARTLRAETAAIIGTFLATSL